MADRMPRRLRPGPGVSRSALLDSPRSGRRRCSRDCYGPLGVLILRLL